MTSESRGLFLGTIAVVMFGLTLPVTRLISPYLDPIFIGLGRASFAAILAALFLIISGLPIPSRKQFKQLSLVALGVVIGFPVCSAWAMQSLPASHGGVVLGVLPLATAAASRLVSDERPSLSFWVVGATGSALVVGYSLLQGGGAILIGDLALFLAVLSASFGYAIGGKLSKEMAGWQVISWALVIAFPVTLIPTIYVAPDDLNQIDGTTIIGFVYLALVSQLFGFFIWYKALAIGGIARVSQTQLLQPFVTLLVSTWVLSETVSAITYLFIVAVVAIVAIGKKMPIYSKSQ